MHKGHTKIKGPYYKKPGPKKYNFDRSNLAIYKELTDKYEERIAKKASTNKYVTRIEIYDKDIDSMKTEIMDIHANGFTCVDIFIEGLRSIRSDIKARQIQDGLSGTANAFFIYKSTGRVSTKKNVRTYRLFKIRPFLIHNEQDYIKASIYNITASKVKKNYVVLTYRIENNKQTFEKEIDVLKVYPELLKKFSY